MAQDDDEITEILYRHIPGWLVLCFALGIAGLIATVALLHRAPSEEDPCDRCARLRAMSFAGRISALEYHRGVKAAMTIRHAGRKRRIRDVNPHLKDDFSYGDSIRKEPGTTLAWVSDAYRQWHCIRLFVCTDTVGCRD
jgi:hypothetical protein